jgi:acetoin utilization protein AcuB
MISISDYMRVSPFTIGNDMRIEQALERMRANEVRHLPVLKAGALVGMVSDRDINLVYAVPGGKKMKVEEVMTEAPYRVSKDTPLSDVVHEMARKKYGAAVVVDKDDRVLGIFTAIDGLQILEEALKSGRVP